MEDEGQLRCSFEKLKNLQNLQNFSDCKLTVEIYGLISKLIVMKAMTFDL